jgi:DNA-directed RNA polymerase specialized sigma24 family protein
MERLMPLFTAIRGLRPRNPLKPTGSPEEQVAQAARLTTDTIEAAARGDAAAFMTLYYAKARAVAAYIAPAFEDERDRDRQLRRVFLRAWRDLPSLDRSEAFDLWLLRIAREELDQTVDLARRARSSGDPVVDELAALPQRLHEVVSLRHLFGLSNEQVALVYGATPRQTGDWHRQGLEGLAVATAPATRLRRAA